MLYSDRRYDISEQVLRTILRTNNQNQIVSRREKKKLEQESIISKPNTEVSRIVEIDNKKNEEGKKNELESEKKNLTIEERKKILEEKRKKILDARKAILEDKNISKDSTFTKN